MRKLTNDEIKKLTDGEEIDKLAADNYLRNMPPDSLDAMDKLVQIARKAKWKKPTILACLNGIWLSTGLPPQQDIDGC